MEPINIAIENLRVFVLFVSVGNGETAIRTRLPFSFYLWICCFILASGVACIGNIAWSSVNKFKLRITSSKCEHINHSRSILPIAATNSVVHVHSHRSDSDMGWDYLCEILQEYPISTMNLVLRRPPYVNVDVDRGRRLGIISPLRIDVYTLMGDCFGSQLDYFCGDYLLLLSIYECAETNKYLIRQTFDWECKKQVEISRSVFHIQFFERIGRTLIAERGKTAILLY